MFLQAGGATMVFDCVVLIVVLQKTSVYLVTVIVDRLVCISNIRCLQNAILLTHKYLVG